MKLIQLYSQNISEIIKSDKLYIQFEKLIFELNKRDLPNLLVDTLNQEIEEINASIISEKGWKNTIKKKQFKILRLLEKELKIVPINYYRNVWLAIGIGGIGIPIGFLIGTSLGSMAFLGLGMPIGLGIGLAVGMGMDKKAKVEGRQLDVELKN